MAPGGQPRARALRVLVGDERGRPLAVPGLRRWLAAVAPSNVRGTISVAVVSDRRIRDLNRRYRGYDHATDVLSFPVDCWDLTSNTQPPASARARSKRATARLAEAPKARRRFAPNPQSLTPNPFLGDIVIARGVARRQARAAGHADLTELRILALHGLLHLIGYDHERDDGLMRRVERRLGRKGGLRAGLTERAAPRRVSETCEHASSLGARGALLGRAPRR